MNDYRQFASGKDLADEAEQQARPELALIDRSQFMPAMTIESAVDRFNSLVEFVSRVLRKDVDYGVIPGTGKPTLLKPGAEKLTTFFGLSTRFQLIERIEDWSGAGHGGEPFFYYMYRCQLSRGDLLIAESDGSCNSRESKYRYREAQRVCPDCKQAAIIKGKEEYGGGYLCFKKKGGCGAKFSNGDPAIEGQPIGRVPNPDIADQVNTIQKMAQKRCLGSTTPVFIRTSRGVSPTDLDELYVIFRNGNEDVHLPGVDGSWRKVMAMVRDEGRVVFRIELADGSYIRATAEHRFPTSEGLRTVEELKPGDCFLRSLIHLPQEEQCADEELGWVAGLYIAEGHIGNKCVKFTLHQDEVDIAARIESTAARLGSRTHIHPRPNGLTLNTCVNGPAFRGVIEQFVDGSKSYQKHLSKSAWRQGSGFLQHVLQGYLAGDGSWTEREGRQGFWRLGFTGRNFELAHDIRALGAVFGSRVSLKRSNARLKGIEFPTFTGWIKSCAPKYNAKDLNEIVSIVRETNPAVVYDVEVDGDHLFCLANGIQTHNSLIAATLLAVNASEFFTQDVEDMMIAGGTMEVIDETPAVLPPSAPSYVPPIVNRPPASSQPVVNQITPDKKNVEAVSLMSEHARLTKEIIDACHALGRSEEQLADWVRKKYGVEEIDSLTAFDKREVLAFLQNRLTPQANS